MMGDKEGLERVLSEKAKGRIDRIFPRVSMETAKRIGLHAISGRRWRKRRGETDDSNHRRFFFETFFQPPLRILPAAVYTRIPQLFQNIYASRFRMYLSELDGFMERGKLLD